MYHIAIGDDDPIFLRGAETLVSQSMEADGLKQGADFDITVYSSAPPLLDDLRQDRERYHLLILDVEFGEDNGIQTASALRELQAGFSLIYVTNHREYVFQSFDTRPLHYLLKPVDQEKLAALIREDYQRRYVDARLYLKKGGKHLALPFSGIYAVEASSHRVLLHLQDRMEEWTGSFRALTPKLPGWRFCQCHNSYFINLTHVTELVRYEARLDNGQVIPISKRFYKSAIAQYIAFLEH